MAAAKEQVVFNLNDRVSHIRRNKEKVNAIVSRVEYPGTKGSWIEIQPVDKKGAPVGKTIVTRPSQVKLRK